VDKTVGDYAPFVTSWTQPNGGIRGYLTRFLASGDPTFQHIAIWTLLQLLESEDEKLVSLIGKSEDIVGMIKSIGEQDVAPEGNDSSATTAAAGAGTEAAEEEGGEGEVVALARRSLQLLGQGEKTGLVEG